MFVPAFDSKWGVVFGSAAEAVFAAGSEVGPVFVPAFESGIGSGFEAGFESAVEFGSATGFEFEAVQQE